MNRGRPWVAGAIERKLRRSEAAAGTEVPAMGRLHAARSSPLQEETPVVMNTRVRVLSTLASVAIVVGACTSGASQSPAGSTGTGAQASAPTTSSGPAAALKGELTVWHSYGSGAGTEA